MMHFEALDRCAAKPVGFKLLLYAFARTAADEMLAKMVARFVAQNQESFCGVCSIPCRIIGNRAIPLAVECYAVSDANRSPDLKAQCVYLGEIWDTDEFDKDLDIIYDRRLKLDVGIAKLIFMEGAYSVANMDRFLRGSARPPNERTANASDCQIPHPDDPMIIPLLYLGGNFPHSQARQASNSGARSLWLN
jgi:hypothetical protein